MGVPTLHHRIYATCTRHVHMRAFLYELAYVYKPTAYGNVTAVPMQWHKHHAAYTDMPNMCPFVDVTTRGMNGEGFDQS